MTDIPSNRSRRRALTSLGAALLLTAVPGAGGRAESPPYPTRTPRRLVPRPLEAYDSAKLSGGPDKDGIPSIDRPRFWTRGEADSYLDGGDVVFGLVVGDVVRAYPQRILVWHEIVNDALGDRALAVTYCPLTGTAIAFERGGTTFGVSGRLVNSNLIMFDRASDTWIPQILATGISGPHAGGSLVEHPLVWTTWERWARAYPDSEVLSTETGFVRNYRRDPYGAYNPPSGYYAPESGTIFPLMHRDDRHPSKSVFLGARSEAQAVVFRLESLRAAGRLELVAEGQVFTAVYDERFGTGYIFRGRAGGRPAFRGFGPSGVAWDGGDRLEPLNAFEGMWFAWKAFYPEAFVHD